MTQSSTRLKSKIGKWRQRLEPLLPALLLLRRLRCLRLLTFRHCCPPSHESWRVSHQCVRESTRTAFHLLQHNEKSSVPLNEVCIAGRKTHASRRSTTSIHNAIALQHTYSIRNDANARTFAKTSIKSEFLAHLDNVARTQSANANAPRARQNFVSICFTNAATTHQKKFTQGGAKTGRRWPESIKNERISAK